MHPVVRKGPLFYKKNTPLLSTFFTKKHPPFSIFLQKTVKILILYIMHPEVRKGPFFYKKHPLFSTFFCKKTPPFSTFLQKHPPFHFLPAGLLKCVCNNVTAVKTYAHKTLSNVLEPRSLKCRI